MVLTAGILGALTIHGTTGGLFGLLVKESLLFLFGSGALGLTILAALGGIFLILRRNSPLRPAFWVGCFLLFILYTGAAASLVYPPGTELAGIGISLGGGAIGNGLAYLAFRLFGSIGREIVAAAAFAVAMVLIANSSWLVILGKGRGAAVKGAKAAANGAKASGNFFANYFLEQVEEDTDQTEGEGGGSARNHKSLPPARRKLSLVTLESSAASESGSAFEGGASQEKKGPSPQRYSSMDPTSLLQPGSRSQTNNLEAIEEKKRVLEDTLESFGVKGKVVNVEEGPVVTRFEILPPPGIKVSRIVNLADDIALAMAAVDVRIEAPVPGKGVVGIEIPNRETASVRLREVLESNEFASSPSPLTVGLGKDIAGRPVIIRLETMPHLLIAGATGSGKSVCLNAVIASLLCKAKPEELKLILIDPKMVELSIFNGIPHLLTPVVTSPRQAAKTLHWAVREMERRYDVLAAAGMRDISRYNAAAEKNGVEALPYIVLIIDELADLMMVAPVDVEETVCRLAQMARAAGIHLVVATQRPSTEVITGLIKANIPSRIAFAVSSQVDSRTILDMGGAERLLGKGDMLYAPLGANKPVRVQGAFVSEREVETLVEFHRQQGSPSYGAEISAVEVDDAEKEAQEGDELFPAAVKVVVEAGQASVSFLQRKLRVGYTRAARLVDAMEERNFVGPPDGSKPREVRITLEMYRQLFPE